MKIKERALNTLLFLFLLISKTDAQESNGLLYGYDKFYIESSTICLDCVPSPWRLKVNLDWSPYERSSQRPDIDMHIYGLQDGVKHIYYGQRQLKSVPNGLFTFGRLDCDDRGRSATGNCMATFGEDFRVPVPSSGNALLPKYYCFKLEYFSHLNKDVPIDLTINYLDKVIYSCKGELNKHRPGLIYIDNDGVKTYNERCELDKKEVYQSNIPGQVLLKIPSEYGAADFSLPPFCQKMP